MLQTWGNIMSRKPYSRTFRYSEETRKILDQYDGDFDSLVHYAFFTIAEQEEKVKSLKKEEDRLHKVISSKCKELSKLNGIIQMLNALSNDVKDYCRIIGVELEILKL